MAKKVVPYSRPVTYKLPIKLTETYILAFIKNVSTYSERFKIVFLRASYFSLLVMPFYW